MSTAITLPISNAPGLVGDSPWTTWCPYFSDYDPSLACPEADPNVSTMVITVSYTYSMITEHWHFNNAFSDWPGIDHSIISSMSTRNVSLTGSLTLTRKKGITVYSDYGSPTAGPYFSIRRASIFNSRSGCSVATTPTSRIAPLWWFQFGTNILHMSGTDNGGTYVGSNGVTFDNWMPSSILTPSDVAANPPKMYFSWVSVDTDNMASTNSPVVAFNNWKTPGTANYTGTTPILSNVPSILPVWYFGRPDVVGSWTFSGSQTFNVSVALT